MNVFTGTNISTQIVPFLLTAVTKVLQESSTNLSRKRPVSATGKRPSKVVNSQSRFQANYYCVTAAGKQKVCETALVGTLIGCTVKSTSTQIAPPHLTYFH